MDKRIKKLVDDTQIKFGLEDYYLERYNLHREVNLFNETYYTLSMEWFPNIVAVPDDGLNPEGTAVIEFNITKGQYRSVIFVGGKSFANGVIFPNFNKNDMLDWVEKETGLLYGDHFQLANELERELYFEQCINGVPIYPSEPMEIKVDSKGNLVFFAFYGHYPSKREVKIEKYYLSLEKIEDISKQQLKLVKYPLDDQGKLIWLYLIEEVFVKNSQKGILPFESMMDGKPFVNVNELVTWEEKMGNNFEEKEIYLEENITVEQAFDQAPSPDTKQITTTEQEKCYTAVKKLMSQVYPNDSSKWKLTTLQRDSGNINATLKNTEKSESLLERSITIIIDGENFIPLNYIDNQMMLEMLNQYGFPDPVAITTEEAYEKLQHFFELEPFYVYDFEENQFVLCGALDCQYAMNASNGKVVLIDDLL